MNDLNRRGTKYSRNRDKTSDLSNTNSTFQSMNNTGSVLLNNTNYFKRRDHKELSNKSTKSKGSNKLSSNKYNNENLSPGKSRRDLYKLLNNDKKLKKISSTKLIVQGENSNNLINLNEHYKQKIKHSQLSIGIKADYLRQNSVISDTSQFKHSKGKLSNKNLYLNNRKRGSSQLIDPEYPQYGQDIYGNMNRITEKYSSSSSNEETFTKSTKENKEEEPKLLDNIDEKKIIIDNIEAIYSKEKKISTNLAMQQLLLFLMIIFLNMYKWIFLFQTTAKLERNYCYTKQNQLDSFTIDQICNGYKKKINFFVYNEEVDFIDDFITESKTINKFYKPFFLRHYHQLSLGKVFSKNQINSNLNEQTNFCVFITKREKWNYFYNNFSSCSKTHFHCLLVIFIAVGGIIGAFIFGLISDILGRKIVTGICFGILTFGSLVITFINITLYVKGKRAGKEFDEEYDIDISMSDKYYTILKSNYIQKAVQELNTKIFIVALFAVFLISFSIAPLKKSVSILMIENSISEDNILESVRKITLAENSLAPFCVTIIQQIINRFTITWAILFSVSLIFCILSFVYLKESMRFHYEFCQWKQLSKIAFYLIKNIDPNSCYTEYQHRIQKNIENKKKYDMLEKDRIYRKDDGDNNTSHKSQKRESSENNKANGHRASVFDKFRDRIHNLNKNIRRNSDFIIDQQETVENPYIIVTCFLSNRPIQKIKTILIITLILINLVYNIINREMASFSFYKVNDLIIDTKHNIIINSNFFILSFVIFISNFFYYCLFRITCFKSVVAISLILISVFSAIYHILTAEIENSPINLNQYNYGMLDRNQKENRRSDLNTLIFLMMFAINGAKTYISLLLIKLSKTLYRGILLSFSTFISISTFSLTEAIFSEMDHPFLFMSVINLMCILTLFFINEYKEVSHIVNDQKRNVNVEDDTDRLKTE